MRGLALTICIAVGLCLGLWLVFLDYPMATGRLIFDAYDPRTHRMLAETNTPWGIAIRVGLFLVCVSGAIWSVRGWRRSK